MAFSPATFAKRRMSRIFCRDGRTLIVAMDHGNVFNVMPGLANPGHVIEECVAGGADAILTTFGVAKNYPAAFGPAGLILRCDSGKTFMPGSGEGDWILRYGAEDALRLGADGLGCMGFPGTAFEIKTLAHVAKLAAECEQWGLVLMGELLPGGFENRALHTPENMALAARFGAESGCDLVKTEYTGAPDTFRQVVEACYRPVVVLGGSKKESELEVLRMVKDSIDAGGAGVAMGRNVWNHPDPRSFVAALSAIIHRSASVEEAADLLGVRV